MSTEFAVSMNARQLRSNADGFSRLNYLHATFCHHENTEIRVDMSSVAWIDGHLASAFLAIVRLAENRGNSILFANTRPEVRNLLRRNGLFKSRAEDKFKTAIPLREFSLDEAIGFSQYVRQHLARREMPVMTKALESKFYEGIDELFANSALHSRALIRVMACGQFYPRAKRLDFSIVDGGRSIPGSLRESGILRPTDAEAIDWAMLPGNTTRSGDIPGGLGLKVLRDFIRLNGGKLLIVSGRGLWMLSQRGVAKDVLSHPFPGTSVVLEINTSDMNQYDLVGAPNPKDIW